MLWLKVVENEFFQEQKGSYQDRETDDSGDEISCIRKIVTRAISINNNTTPKSEERRLLHIKYLGIESQSLLLGSDLHMTLHDFTRSLKSFLKIFIRKKRMTEE